MKKNIWIYLVLAVALLSTLDAKAEDAPTGPPSGDDYNMQDAGMGSPGREGTSNRREMMKGGMGGGMMDHNKRNLVATSDGGIVILDGPRLLKYDAQLNLVGEAELKPGKKPGSANSRMRPRNDKPSEEESSAVPPVDIPNIESTGTDEIAGKVNDAVEPLPS